MKPPLSTKVSFPCVTLDTGKRYFCAQGVVTIGTQHDASSTLYIRILNDNNKVTISQSLDGKTWLDINKYVDVSEYHHNVYKGFFALRPAYFLDGDATLESFTYKPL